MTQVSIEMQQKFKDKVKREVSVYGSVAKNMNPILTEYGQVFFDYSNGKLTQEYFEGIKEKTLEKIRNSVDTIIESILDGLKRIQEEYEREVYDGENTTDALELDFLARELEVMDAEELKQFYSLNVKDKNKMRLFSIELKKRKRSDEGKEEAFAVEYYIQLQAEHDPISKLIKQQIKIYSSIRGMKEAVYLFNEKAQTEPLREDIFQLLSIKNIVNYVQAKSCMSRPNEIMIEELIEEM